MIKKLTKSDQTSILEFAYKREMENLFITGAFERYEDPFATNTFYGYFEDGELIGLAVHFGNWNNVNISSQNEVVVRTLTDHIVKNGHQIDDLACFRQYGEIIMDQLEKEHGIKPKTIEDKSVYKLLKEDFVDFSTGKEEIAKDSDREELVRLEKLIFNNEPNPKITEHELSLITPEQQFVIRMEGKIVSTANLNGLSKNYFQIGGVATLEEYREQGLAKQVVSALCKNFFAEGKTGILFTNNDNLAAQKVYAALGFKAFDKYMIAKYS